MDILRSWTGECEDMVVLVLSNRFAHQIGCVDSSEVVGLTKTHEQDRMSWLGSCTQLEGTSGYIHVDIVLEVLASGRVEGSSLKAMLRGTCMVQATPAHGKDEEINTFDPRTPRSLGATSPHSPLTWTSIAFFPGLHHKAIVQSAP